MPTILTPHLFRALDINGFTVPGALATFSDSGTTGTRIVYADPECSIPHPSPLVANGAGVFPQVFDTGDGDVRVTVTDANGAVLAGYPIDPTPRVSTDEAGAASVQFNPTVEIPVTDVQGAIERVQANIVAPLADFGLGVTGNAALLSSIDATSIASGSYRYDATTAGTYPSGVTAEAGGNVRVWRELSGEAVMILFPRGSTRMHTRSLTAGAWAAWNYAMRNTDTASSMTWAAGTSTTAYATSPANVKTAIDAQAIGNGQSWRAVGRNPGTTYRNTTGRTISVCINYDGGDDDRAQVSTDGSDWASLCWRGGIVTFAVPPGHYYRLSGGFIWYWSELR